MKKIYTFATVALFGFSAAIAEQRQQAITFSLVKANAALTEQVADLNIGKAKPAKAPARIPLLMSELNGTYDWAYENLLNGSGPNPELVITVTDETTGAAIISGFPQDYEVEATIDVKANTLSIPNNQNLGKDSNGDINYFYIKSADDEGYLIDGASDVKSTVGEINGTTITFPMLDIWAIGDPDAEDLGWWSLTYANELSVQKEKIYYGEATVSGDMLFGAFGKTPADYTVDVYTDEDKINLIVKDPLKGLYSSLGWSGDSSPDMILDTTYPDNILIDLFSTGISGGEDGTYYGLSYSAYSAMMGDIADTPEEYRIVSDQGTDTEVITIPQKALLLLASATNSIYYGNSNAPIVITIKKESAGIENITIEDSNAPVEFFNLQGQRVDKPASGQIVIKRQGDAVTKVLVK